MVYKKVVLIHFLLLIILSSLNGQEVLTSAGKLFDCKEIVKKDSSIICPCWMDGYWFDMEFSLNEVAFYTLNDSVIKVSDLGADSIAYHTLMKKYNKTVKKKKSGVQNSTISFNPLGTIGTFAIKESMNIHVSYERKLDTTSSYLVTLQFQNMFASGYNEHSLFYSWYGIQPEIRHYTKQALKKFYMGAFIPIMLVKEEYFVNDISENKEIGNLVGVGARIGYKIGKDILVDPSLYVGYGWINGLDTELDYPDGLLRLKHRTPIIGFSLKLGFMLKS